MIVTSNWRLAWLSALVLMTTACKKDEKKQENTPCGGTGPIASSGGAGGASGAAATTPAGGTLGDPGSSTALTGTKVCANSNDCTAGSPSTGFECTMFDGACATAGAGGGYCKIKYASTSYRCIAGARVQCTTPIGALEGVYTCNGSGGDQPCDWPTNGCKKCGASGEPCCVRGCDATLKCKPAAGGTGGSLGSTCQL